MKLVNLVCPGCGAQMQVKPGGKEAVCEYCGQRMLIEEEQSKEQAAYERKMGVLRANQEMEEERKRKEAKHKVITGLITAAVLGLCVLFYIQLRSKINPSEYSGGAFSGRSGDGNDEIQLKDENTDIILTDISELNDASINLIHLKSEAMNRQGTEPSYLIKNEVISAEPVKMFFITDGKNNNLLYDVYEVSYKLHDDSVKTVYLVTYYKNIILRKGEETTMDYEECMYTGDTINLGNYQDSVLTGYFTLDEVKMDIQRHQESNMKLIER